MSKVEKLQSSDGFRFDAYIAEPVGEPKASVVLLQEIFGVNSHIRSVAEKLASEGFWVIAPSTFARVKEGVELGYSEQDMKDGFALKTAVAELPELGVLVDIQAAIDFAKQQNENLKVGITGFCWGGLLTWQAAAKLSGLSAAVTYYGGGMTSDTEVDLDPVVPVVAHFGDKDHWISLESVDMFKKRHPNVEVHIYAADHGFNCDQRASYNEAAAKLAWQRTIAFFNANLAS